MQKQQIYFPFAEYEREIHSMDSCYQAWQMECAVYDNLGKVCPIPYQIVKAYLKQPIDWMWYLIDAPQEYQTCDFSRFNDLLLYFLLRERVELAKVVPWQKMKEEYKNLLLAYHPELAESITELQNLSGNHWQKILQVQPKYHIYCPWQKLSGDNWQVILEEHPELSRYYNFSLFSIENWAELLKKQIRFLAVCPTKIINEIPNDDMNELFILYPEIKNIWSY